MVSRISSIPVFVHSATTKKEKAAKNKYDALCSWLKLVTIPFPVPRLEKRVERQVLSDSVHYGDSVDSQMNFNSLQYESVAVVSDHESYAHSPVTKKIRLREWCGQPSTIESSDSMRRGSVVIVHGETRVQHKNHQDFTMQSNSAPSNRFRPTFRASAYKLVEEPQISQSNDFQSNDLQLDLDESSQTREGCIEFVAESIVQMSDFCKCFPGTRILVDTVESKFRVRVYQKK